LQVVLAVDPAQAGATSGKNFLQVVAQLVICIQLNVARKLGLAGAAHPGGGRGVAVVCAGHDASQIDVIQRDFCAVDGRSQVIQNDQRRVVVGGVAEVVLVVSGGGHKAQIR